jgi:hypothetical protein
MISRGCVTFIAYPKQVGACRIVGDPSKGPERVIVEWTTKDCPCKEFGTVSVIKRATLQE